MHMNDVDLRYLCTTIGNLAGIPIRVFEDGVQTFYHSVIFLPKDPMCLCRGNEGKGKRSGGNMMPVVMQLI